jgi:hypothetical protein
MAVDRRARKVGQIWHNPTYSYSGSYGLPPGTYQIIDVFENDWHRPFIKVYNKDRNRTHDVPRKIISTSRDNYWKFVEDAPLPKAKAQVIVCGYCGAGTVVEVMGNQHNHKCQYCGGGR